MGEQPGPVEDEVERALVSMRAGFLSGANQIAAEIASLEAHLEDAPDEERDAVGAAIAQVINAQARLTARMESLPAASWDRFKAMVAVVKGQQSVLDQLGDLVQKYVLPRQLENLSLSPLPGPPPPPAYSPEPPSEEDYEPSPQGESFLRAQAALQALDAHLPRTGRRARADFGEDDERRSLFARARERTAGFRGVAVMIVAAVGIGLAQRDGKLQDLAARFVAMVSAGIEAAAPDTHPDRHKDASPKVAPKVAARPQPPAPPAPSASTLLPAERAPAQAEAPIVEPQPRPPPPPVAPDRKPTVRPASVAPADVAAASERPSPAAAAPPAETHASAAPAVPEPAAPPTGVPQDQFVPVVFTHKDYDTVMRALADLKQRFPSILTGRQGEVQPVDLGRKGIWHRLVLVPPGPRPEAARLCEQLKAAGYNRCWVKDY
jgi:hypothetical protein